MTSCTHFLNSLVLSPLLLWPILFFGRMHLEQTIYAYLSLALPKPDNPDRYSLKGAMEDGLDSDTIPGLDIPRSKIYLMGSKSVNLLEEIKKDACAMARVFWDAFSSWTPKKKTAEQNLNDVQDAENPRIVPMSPQPADSLGSEREIIVPLFSLSQRSSPVPMPYVNTSQNSPEHSVLPSTSPLARPRASSRASSQAPQRESDNNTLQTPQISTRAEEATILDSMAQNLSIPEPEGSALMDELPMPDYEEARISSQVGE